MRIYRNVYNSRFKKKLIYNNLNTKLIKFLNDLNKFCFTLM